MNIALLNIRIKILKAEIVTDEIGNHTNSWSDYYECFATVSGESPSENYEVGNMLDNSKVNFTIRYSDKIKDLNSLNYRVLFNNSIYDIKGIDHNNYKHKCIKLSCQKEFN